MNAATICFFILTILGGQVCVPLFLATCLLSKRVNRHPLLLGFMTCWVAYSLATCILLYSGHQDDKEVDHALCLAQAASVNGSLIAAAIAAFLLVLHLRLTMPRADRPFAKLGFGPKATFGFAVTPPICLIVYLSALLAVERRHPGLLQTERRDLICGFRSTGAAWYADRITPIIIGVFLVVSLCLSSFLFTITYSRRANLHSGSSSAPWMRVLLRFTIFAVYAFLTALACLFRIVLKDTMTLHTVVALYVATLPLAAFFVFGSLPDILSVWFRRPSYVAAAATPATRSATVPWDLHDPDEMTSRFSQSGETLTREGAMSERWEPSAPIVTAAQHMPAVGPGEKPSSAPVVNRTGSKKGNVLRKTSGPMRSASGSKQLQPNFTGTSDSNDGSQRPHLAEAYYVNRIAREYYANRLLEERARAAAHDHDDVTSALRYTPSDSLLRSTPNRSTPNRSTPESDYFTQPPARRSSPHRQASARPPVVPRPSEEVPNRHVPPRRPLSRPSSLYDADPEADAELFYSAPSDPESPTTLGSPVPLLPSPARQAQLEYTMPVMAPRAAYAAHHYMAMAPVRQTPGSSGL